MKESVELRTNIPLKWIGGIPYCAILLLVCLFAWNRPLYNADILPYMGVIISYEHGDTAFSANTLHEKVYATARKQLPADVYKQLTEDNPEGRKLAKNANEFSQQLPFYVVKPLYTLLTYTYYKSGLKLVQATLVLSVLSYFFIGLLVLTWITKYLPYWPAFLISLLVMISPPMLEAVRLSSPDCLSALMVLGAIYFFTEKKKYAWGYCILLASVFVRIDNILPLICMIIMLARQKKLSTLNCVLGILLAFVCYFNITYSAYYYGWDIVYFTTFIKHMTLAYNAHVGFTIDGYIALVKLQLMTGLYYSHIIFFAILIVLLFIKKPGTKARKYDLEQVLCLVIVLIILCRFIMHPIITDRLYIAYYLTILIFLAKKYTSLVKY